MKNIALMLTLMGCIAVNAQSITKKNLGPDCSGGWPTKMAYAKLKNAGLINESTIDLSQTKSKRLASQTVDGKIWHQVYLVTFVNKSGVKIDVIAIHDASAEECSMTDVDVYVVSQHLQSKN